MLKKVKPLHRDVSSVWREACMCPLEHCLDDSDTKLVDTWGENTQNFVYLFLRQVVGKISHQKISLCHIATKIWSIPSFSRN